MELNLNGLYEAIEERTVSENTKDGPYHDDDENIEENAKRKLKETVQSYEEVKRQLKEFKRIPPKIRFILKFSIISAMLLIAGIAVTVGDYTGSTYQAAGWAGIASGVSSIVLTIVMGSLTWSK